MVNALFFRSLELNNIQKELVLKGLYREGSFLQLGCHKWLEIFCSCTINYYKMEPRTWLLMVKT